MPIKDFPHRSGDDASCTDCVNFYDPNLFLTHPVAIRICIYCGTKNPWDNRFCYKCGKMIGK